MDSRNRDTKNIALMVDGLLEIGYVNTFLLVFNALQPRLDESLQGSIKLFTQMFPEFLGNAIFIFTKFSYSNSSVNRRERGLEMNES